MKAWAVFVLGRSASLDVLPDGSSLETASCWPKILGVRFGVCAPK